MAVDTNELLHRIGAVLRGISDKMDRLIEIGERPAREIQFHEMLEDSGEHEGDHFAGADKMVAEEPKKKWRRLTDEFVHPGDWMNAKVNRQDVYPPDGGWIPADPCYFGKRACTLSLYFARPVAEEPAKEAESEHPAGPMPDPGEGYRIVSKDPPEKLSPGDDFWSTSYGEWHKSTCAASGIAFQSDVLWFRRKIEPPKPPEPEYREPVLPADYKMACEFSDNGSSWASGRLGGWRPSGWISTGGVCWRHCRIKKDA